MTVVDGWWLQHAVARRNRIKYRRKDGTYISYQVVKGKRYKKVHGPEGDLECVVRVESRWIRSLKHFLTAEGTDLGDFNEGFFPLEPVARDEKEWEVFEYEFDSDVNGEDAVRILEEKGLKFCGLRRAVKHVKRHYRVIGEYGVISFPLDYPLIVTQWKHLPFSAGPYMPIFFPWMGLCCLELRKLRKIHDKNYRWLVLRRRTQRSR